MDSLYLWFGVLLYAYFFIFTFRKYDTLIVPALIYVTLEVFIKGLFGYLVCLSIKNDVSELVASDVVAFTSFYLFAFIIGNKLRFKTFTHSIYKVTSLSTTGEEQPSHRKCKILASYVLVGSLICFVALALVGGGGELWIIEPRSAYLTYRQGVGFFWSLFSTGLALSFILYLYGFAIKKIYILILLSGIYGFLGYYTGSKQTIFGIWMTAIFYYNFQVRQISFYKLLILGFFSFVIFLTVTMLQSGFNDLIDAASYFDYFYQTALFFENISSFPRLYGDGFLSTFWEYAPRALFPDKPFDYGVAIISSVLYPGAGESGYTPGFLNWTLSYYDFGVGGVLVLGLLHGQLLAVIYDLLLKHKYSIVLLVLNLDVAFKIVNAPASIFVGYMLSTVLALFVVQKKRQVNNSHITTIHPPEKPYRNQSVTVTRTLS